MKTIAAAVLLLAATAQAGQSAYTILYKPDKGSKTEYTLTFDIQDPNRPATYGAKIVNEIVDVKADGTFIVASYQTDHYTIVDGKKEPSPAETITAVTTYDKFGKPTAIGGDVDTPESFRVANLTSFIAPQKQVAIGGTWTAKITGDPKKGTRDATHSYKLVSVTNNIATIEMSVVEESGDFAASVKGRVWVDLQTGDQTKFEYNVKNMPIGSVYIDGKVTITKK